MKAIQEKTKKTFVRWVALAIAIIMVLMIILPAIFESTLIG